jgi:hypothetical protein
MSKPPYGCDNVANKLAALTVFPKDTPESEKPLQSLKEEPKGKRSGLDSQALDETTRYSKSWLVKTAQDVTIAPRCRRVVTAKVDMKKGREIPSRVEHRAGTKIPHADALSRHVGTISGEIRLSSEEVSNGQSKDPLFVRIKPRIYSSKSEFFYDDEGLIQETEERQASVSRS